MLQRCRRMLPCQRGTGIQPGGLPWWLQLTCRTCKSGTRWWSHAGHCGVGMPFNPCMGGQQLLNTRPPPPPTHLLNFLASRFCISLAASVPAGTQIAEGLTKSSASLAEAAKVTNRAPLGESRLTRLQACAHGKAEGRHNDRACTPWRFKQITESTACFGQQRTNRWRLRRAKPNPPMTTAPTGASTLPGAVSATCAIS